MVRLLCAVTALMLYSTANGRVSVDGRVEPTCLSRFDHDFKVLQKLVELEQEQKEITTKLTRMDQRQEENEKEQLFKKDGCDDRCPNGWTTFKNSCYGLFDDIELNWDQAVQHCAAFCGAHLASLETYDEQVFLREIVLKLKNSVGSGNSYWNDATDNDQEGKWVWKSSGKPVSDGEVRWHPGQPNGLTDQNCGCLWGDSGYKFFDYKCYYKSFFICEKQLGSGGK